MADTRGTFRLKNVRQDILNNEYVPIPSVWLPAPPLNPDTADTAYWGAFGGGGDSLYKIPVPSDTWSLLPANLGSVNAGEATGSQTAGFVSGGYSYSWYKKLTYSSDTTSTAHPGGGNAYRNWDNTALTDGSNGYWLGGERIPGSAVLSSSEKLTYASSTVSAGPNLPETRAGFIGSTGSTTTGYMCGGATPGRRSNMFKLVYSSSTISEVPGAHYPAPIGTGDQSGNGVTDTHGYFVGGVQPSGAMSVNCKLTYSNETFAREPGGNLPRSSYYLSTTGNREKGYWGGGESPGSPNPVKNSDVFKLTYSNSTFANVPSSIQFNPNTWGEKARGWGPRKGGVPATGSVKRWVDDAAQTGNHAYFGLGFPSSGDGNFKKLDLDTETVGSSTQMYTPGLHQFAVGSSRTIGYNFGGSYQGATKSRVYKITYATNTGSTGPANLNRTRRQGTSNSNLTDAYMSRGYSDTSPDGNTTDATKYTYATDTAAAYPPKWSQQSLCGQGCGNQEDGYQTYGSGTTITKLTYSTDTISTIPGQLSTPRYEFSSSVMASPTSGYFIGGSPGSGDAKSSIDKVTWSTGTVSAGSNLGSSGNNPGAKRGQATSNHTVGYINFGSPAQPSAKDNKYTFATDTVEDKGNLFSHAPNTYSTAFSVRMNAQPVNESPTATPTASTTETGVAEKGYIFGGNPGPLDAIDKLDMSTETISSTGSTLEDNNKRMVCFGNTTTAYATGGASPVKSWIQKFVYSTDVRTKLPATLQSSRGYMGGISNNTIGYTMGGASGNKKQMDKFVMATETNSAIPDMPSARYRNCTWGSDTTGYTGSGYPSPGMQTVNKITYSNDTQSNTTNLSRSTTLAAGVSNATIGYIVGGEQSKTAVDKWTMSSDSCSRIPGANLPASRYAWEQANNTPTKGYFVGGAPGANSDTFVLTFSSDSTALSPTCFVSTPSRSGAGAAGPNQRGNAGSNMQPVVI